MTEQIGYLNNSMKTILSTLAFAALSFCAFAQDAKPYGIVIRFNPDGSVRGAHQTKLITVTLPDGSTLNKETDPEPIKVADLPKTLSPVLAQLSQAIADKDSAEKATADLQAAQAALISRAKPALENWDVSALRDVLIEAQTPELEKQKAQIDAQIKALTEQKTKLDSETK